LIPVLERLKTRMDDWPQLRRYQAANAEVAPPAAGEGRVVFLGDSITDAWINPRFGGFFPGKPYLDRGISGQTTPQMVLRMRADVIALKPKAMVLLAGTNDIAGNTGPMTLAQIEDNITTIAELATLHDIKVILASVLPTSNYHFKGTDPRLAQTGRRPLETIRALNAWLQDYAQQHGHVYLDYFDAMVDSSGMLKTEFSQDDLHPTAAGYAVMAPLAEAAIAKALGNSASNAAK
jgi:lysophospholipase L1-like esterase